MVCAFTGHRPHKLPWGTDESDPRCQAVKIILCRLLQNAYDLGCRTFLCGMAQGCDTYFAEAVLTLREQKSDVRLVAMIPCPEQASRWNKKDRARYERLCSQCDDREVLEPEYTPGCMLRRNRTMIDCADVLISVYDGTGGGTGNAVRYAAARGVTVLPVWL